MQTNHANAIKGLSIATIILAALGILGAVLTFAITSMMGSMLLEFGPDMVASGHASGSVHGMEYEYDMSDEQAVALISMLMSTVGGGISIWILICHVVILIAGIMGLRGYNNPEKLGSIFIWAIVGAVLSFLGGGIITMVLMIVVAVFANKDKKLSAGVVGAVPVAAVPTAAPVAGSVPTTAAPTAAPTATAAPVAQPAVQPTAQPVAAMPVQPAAQPGVTSASTTVPPTSNGQPMA